jgi:peptide/nickel transport system substrate-binding protein
MAYAINRKAVSTIGESGYEPASNQSSIVTPTYSSWYDKSQAAKYGNAYAYDPAKAISILKAAGYKKGSNGIFAKDGKELNFTIINNGGYSDWVAAVNVIETDLKAVGIGLTPDNLSGTTWESDLDTGNFQLAYSWDSGGPTPYYELRAILDSVNTAPIGKSASDDWERYDSAATDALFTQYSSTTSSAVQHTVIDELQKVMLADVPVIPVTEAVDWYQYDTQSIGGWVTPSDPYAQPNQYQVPDWGVVLLHLYEK